MALKSQSHDDIPAYRKYYKLYVYASIVAVVSVVLIYSVLSNLYLQTKTIIINQSKSSLLTLAQTQALRFSSDDVDKVATTSDIGTPSYIKLVTDLADIKKIAPKIAFAYIMKYSATSTYPYTQIADADSLDPYANVDDRLDNDIDINKDGKIDPYGADELTVPGLVYEDAPVEELNQAHDKPHINQAYYTDTWGTFLGVSVPIKRKDGSLAGIFALDMRDDDIQALEETVFKPFVTTMIIIITSMLLLGFALVYTWQKKLKQILSFDRQKNIVIGMIGHELKNPLSAIRWVLSSALEYKDTPVPELVSKKISQAYDVAVSAAEMSNTILDLSRIQLGKLDFVKENCDLNAIVSSVQSEMQPIAQSKGIILDFNNCVENALEKVPIYASPQYMKIAVKNLISNAIKYTPEGGRVDIAINNFGENKIILTVSDTGIGISEENQKHMFEKFSRVQTVSSIEGHGLGLYLTNHIAALHGGSLRLASVVNQGTEFTMEIPKTQV